MSRKKMHECIDCQTQFTTKFNLERHSNTVRCKDTKAQRDLIMRTNRFITTCDNLYSINSIYKRQVSDPILTMFQKCFENKRFTQFRKKYYDKKLSVEPEGIAIFTFSNKDADILSSMWLKIPLHEYSHDEIEISYENTNGSIVLFSMNFDNFKCICRIKDGYYDLRELCLPEHCSIVTHDIIVKIRNSTAQVASFELSGQMYHLTPDEYKKFNLCNFYYIVPTWEIITIDSAIGLATRFPVIDIVYKPINDSECINCTNFTMLPGGHPDIKRNPEIYYHLTFAEEYNLYDGRVYAGAYAPGTVLFTQTDRKCAGIFYIRYLTSMTVSDSVMHRGLFEPESTEDKLYHETIEALKFLKEHGELPSTYKKHKVTECTNEGIYYKPGYSDTYKNNIPNLTDGDQTAVAELIEKCQKYAVKINNRYPHWWDVTVNHDVLYEFTVIDCKFTFTGHLRSYVLAGILIDPEFHFAMTTFVNMHEPS